MRGKFRSVIMVLTFPIGMAACSPASTPAATEPSDACLASTPDGCMGYDDRIDEIAPGTAGAWTTLFQYAPAVTKRTRAPNKNLVQYKVPVQKTDMYKQVSVEFDFYNNGWCTYEAHDQHGLMQLNRGDTWRSNLISWIPIYGQKKGVLIRSNIDNPAPGAGNLRTFKKYSQQEIAPGFWHHANYVYDAASRNITLTVTQQGGGKTFTMVAPIDPKAGSLLTTQYSFFTLTFGSDDMGANGPECGTEGWIFSDVVVKGRK